MQAEGYEKSGAHAVIEGVSRTVEGGPVPCQAPCQLQVNLPNKAIYKPGRGLNNRPAQIKFPLKSSLKPIEGVI
jgi:hypothetical protein